VRRNRDIPNAAKTARLDVGVSRYWLKDAALVVAFREKRSQSKPVLALSTKAPADSVGRKPIMIADTYNHYMCGVDLHDMMLYTYHDERKTVKVWKKVVFNIISRMLLNAYQIYIQNTSDARRLSRLDFYLSVVDDLAMDCIRERTVNNPRNPLQAQPQNIQAGVRRLPEHKEKECTVCSRKDGNPRKRSRTVCVVCGKGLHLACGRYHKH
jgi:hypothetical protein